MFGNIVGFFFDHWEWLTPLLGAPLAAIPFAGPILVFLRTNWKWALPCILLAVAVGAWGFEHTWRITLQRDAARDVAEAQGKVIAFKEADAEKTKALQDAHAAEITRLKDSSNAQIAIAQAKRTTECVATPAARAFTNGMRRFDPEAGAGDAGSAGRAGAPVPAPPATPGGVGRR